MQLIIHQSAIGMYAALSHSTIQKLIHVKRWDYFMGVLMIELKLKRLSATINRRVALQNNVY